MFEVNGTLYLVNEAGRIQDNNRCYRSEGDYRYEYADGTIYYVDADRQRIGEVTSGENLPDVSYKTVYTLN